MLQLRDCNEYAGGRRGPRDKGADSCVPGAKTSENCVSGISCMLISSSYWSACNLAIVDLVLLVDIAYISRR